MNSGFWVYQNAKNVIRRLLPKNIISFTQKPEAESGTIITAVVKSTDIARKNMFPAGNLKNK